MMTTRSEPFEGSDAVFVSGVGRELRAGREAAGLSIEQVAGQLKLAPRQVKALEDEEFGLLPGRTFTRGFLRNYARLLGIDGDALVALLPDATQSRALESPALHPTSTIMGELPSAAMSKPGFGRWLIPLVLVTCIVAAAAYEWYRGGLSGIEPGRPATGSSPPAPSASQAPALPVETERVSVAESAPAPAAAAPSSNASAGVTSTVLPNPVSAAAPAASTSDPPLVLTYRGPSWTEVRDSTGRVIIARLVGAGSVERIDVSLPFDLTLGNASAVSVAYRGAPVELAGFTRAGTARVTLR